MGDVGSASPIYSGLRGSDDLSAGQSCAILSIGMGGYAGACMITQTAINSLSAQSKPAPTAKEHHPCSQLILS